MHFFNIATNLCQRFAIGYEEEPDNFFLRGEAALDRPYVSCRVFDSEGKFLYGMERNRLSADTSPAYRYKITKEGWHTVSDDEGRELLRIESKKDEAGNDVTYIMGEFYDRQGKLAARGAPDGLLVNCPFRMG